MKLLLSQFLANRINDLVGDLRLVSMIGSGWHG